MSTSYQNISASDQARQHNGNVYNHYTNYYPLKQRRSDETLREDDRNRALLKAAAEGQTLRVRKLLKDGADADFREDHEGQTALHHAVSSGFEDVVDELISSGADVNASCSDFGTPICFAALKARSNIFVALLDRRASLEAGKDFGSLAHAACCGGDKSIIAALERRGLSFKSFCEVNANRMAAVRSSDVLIMLEQLRARIWMNCAPIHVAAFFGHAGIVESLLKSGVNIHSTYSEISAAGAAEDWKTETGYTTLMAAAYSGNAETIDLLIDSGADISAKTKPSGATAMWIAAGLGRAPSIALLIKGHFSLEHDTGGTTPTALAAFLGNAANAEEREVELIARHKEELYRKDREIQAIMHQHEEAKIEAERAHKKEIEDAAPVSMNNYLTALEENRALRVKSASERTRLRGELERLKKDLAKMETAKVELDTHLLRLIQTSQAESEQHAQKIEQLNFTHEKELKDLRSMHSEAMSKERHAVEIDAAKVINGLEDQLQRLKAVLKLRRGETEVTKT